MPTTWLQSLKAGDKVVVYNRNAGRRVCEVKHTTPTLIVLTDKRKFRRTDGRLTPHECCSFCTGVTALEQATPEQIEEIEQAFARAVLVDELDEYWEEGHADNFAAYSLAQLKSITSILAARYTEVETE